jgi:hypothetical protein
MVMVLLTTFAIAAAWSPLAQADPLPSSPPASAPTQHPSHQPAMLIAGVVLTVAGAAAVVGVSVAGGGESQQNRDTSCSTPGECPSAFSFTIKDEVWAELAVFGLGTASFVTGVTLIVVGARRLASPDPSVPDPRSRISCFSPSLVSIGTRGPQLTLTVEW